MLIADNYNECEVPSPLYLKNIEKIAINPKMNYLCIIIELFEKHEEYSVTKQVNNFLSIAHSYASSS